MLANYARTGSRLLFRNTSPYLKSQSVNAIRCLSATVEQQIIHKWPKSKVNTLLNVCPQGCLMVIERLGKLRRVQKPGLFFAIPLIDEIPFVIDMREVAIKITPQSGITKDNVKVDVSGNVYCQFIDAEKAAYGANNPLYAVVQHAQSAMRAAIGELELDEILHARARLNTFIQNAVAESAKSWGLEIKRYEITDITPDKFMAESMDKQAAAERVRRAKVLDAEGNKKASELESEGERVRLKNESEGMLIKITNEAEARKRQLLLEVSKITMNGLLFLMCFLFGFRRKGKLLLS